MKKTIKHSCSMIAIAFISIAFTLNAVIGVSEGQGLPPCEENVGDPAILNPPVQLDLVPIPAPDLTGVVRRPEHLVVLGKALFWDQQFGSDNQSCASCHYHAGADHRTKNQLNPGLNIVNNSRGGAADTSFGAKDNPAYQYITSVAGKTLSGADSGANYDLKAGDYPFHKLADPNNRMSTVLYDTNDVTSSQGTIGNAFAGITPTEAIEDCTPLVSENNNIFTFNGTRVRKVPPRNTPTVINAVFNHRNFWDGRANNIFNGYTPIGRRDAQARLVCYERRKPLYLEDFTTVNGGAACINSSLASQSVGPLLSDFEMSCSGRVFPDTYRKIATLYPLALQDVHIDDSVLGPYRRSSGKGINRSYQTLIRLIFDYKYWGDRGRRGIYTKYRIDAVTNPDGTITTTLNVDPAGYTQMELNFSMFWGLAIQAYLSTLVSDQSPYDKFREANPLLANIAVEGDAVAEAGTNLSPGINDIFINYVDGFGELELRGLDIFLNKGGCINCHAGPEFTGASVRLRASVADGGCEEPVERMAMQVGSALYDGGYYNIGVRPTFEDLLVGGTTAGYPISYARQLSNGGADVVDNINYNPLFFQDAPGQDVQVGERVAVDGACKTPTIRNVELTGPYFHNGGEATLMQVVEFYNRGGNRWNVDECVDPDAVECESPTTFPPFE